MPSLVNLIFSQQLPKLPRWALNFLPQLLEVLGLQACVTAPGITVLTPFALAEVKAAHRQPTAPPGAPWS